MYILTKTELEERDRKQRELCAHNFINNHRASIDDNYNNILSAPSPELPVSEIDWEGLERVKKLEWYAWDKKGMIAYKKGVPIEDVFIMRQDVLDLLNNK